MGYRHYFYLIDNNEVERVKNLNYEQLYDLAKNYYHSEFWEVDKDFYFNDEKFMNKKRIFEFGKLYWDDTADRIYSKGNPLFNNRKVQKQLSDYDPYVVGKDGLLEAIKIYNNKIIDYYESFIKGDVVNKIGYTAIDDIIPNLDLSVCAEHVVDYLRWWRGGRALDLDEESNSISNSWIYEHQIFELVRLFKSIDWENQTILFYGW